MNIINALFSNEQLIMEIKTKSRLKVIEKDTALMFSGDDMVFVPIVQKGVLRVVREDFEGRETFLYHLYPAQTCAMAINCCQAGRKSMVKVIAEDIAEVLLVPISLVEDLFKYPEWKAFVNNTYSNRFAELIEVIDLISFSNMDKKVLNYLQRRAKALNSNVLSIVHQQIADELNTHREVVSRLLRTMEQKNILRLGRNTIELLI